MRRSGASIFIYLIFGLLVAIFVININPGKSGQGGGCGCSRSNLVVDVSGARANETAYKVYFSSPSNVGQAKFKEQLAVEGLIRREILASAASDLGLRVTPEMVQEEIKKGVYFTHLPAYGISLQQWDVSPEGRLDLGENIFAQHAGAPKECFETPIRRHNADDLVQRQCYWWSPQKFEGWVKNVHNVSKQSYLDEQARSMQATLMADLLASTVRISRDEAKAEWLFDKNTVTYDVVTFQPVLYKGTMLPSEDDINKYAELHKDEVEKKFKEEEVTYKGTKPAMHVRELHVYVPPDPTKDDEPKNDEPKKDEPKKDDKKPGTGSAATPAPATGSGSAAPAPATGSGSAAPAAGSGSGSAAPAAGSGSAPAPAAGSGSAPPPTPPADPPWIKGEEMKAKLAAAKKDIESGKKKWAEVVKEYATDPQPKHVAGDKGWISKSNPTLSNDKLNKVVKELKVGQISEPILIKDKGVYMLFVEAEREGDLKLEQVRYEIAEKLAKETWSKEKAKRDAIAAIKETADGKKSLEQLYQLEQKKGGGFDDADMEYLQDPTVPIEDKQRYLKQKQGALDKPFVIEGKDVPASSKAQSGGSSGGSSAGSGSGVTAPATPTTPAKAAEPPPIEATTDPLPDFEKYAPKAVRHQNQSKRASMPGIGKLAKLVFDEMGEGDVSKRVYEHNNHYVVFQIVKKSQPDDNKFAEEADTYTEELRTARARKVIEDFLRKRCEALHKDNKITAYRGHEYDENQTITRKFEPCFSFQPPRAIPTPPQGAPPPQ